MLLADVRVASGIPGWNPAAQLRINSGIQVLKPTRWDALIETFNHREEVLARQHREGFPLRSGVSPARDVSGVYVPKPDWRSLSDRELELVAGVTDTVDLHSTVQLVSVPADIIDLARRLTVPHIETGHYAFDEDLMDISGEDLAPIVDLTDAWLAQSLFAHSGWSNFSLRVGRPGRLMASGWKGLHVDLYGPLIRDQLGQRYNGSRLCLNMGDERRYVVFVNRRVASIVRGHPEVLEPADRREALAFAMHERGALSMPAYAFVETYPDYPAIRLTIEPGQGYYAPTPAILHDGYLSGKKNQDLMLFASHKGDQDGFPWRPPDFSPAWTDLCARGWADSTHQYTH